MTNINTTAVLKLSGLAGLLSSDLTEDESFLIDHALQRGFEMLDDDGDVLGCTTKQLARLVRERGGQVERRKADLNDWFAALPEGRRQALMQGDRWMLADAAYAAGIESAGVRFDNVDGKCNCVLYPGGRDQTLPGVRTGFEAQARGAADHGPRASLSRRARRPLRRRLQSA